MSRKSSPPKAINLDDANIRQQIFIDEYLDCLNGTMAYMKAYDVDDTNVAASSASRLLRNAKVKAEIERRFKELTMGKHEVLARLRAVANATLFPFVRVEDDGHVYFNFADPEAKRHLYLIRKLKSKRQDTVNEKTGDIKEEKWIEVELHDAMKALELIGKYHALFTDKVNVNERKTIRVTYKKDVEDNEID